MVVLSRLLYGDLHVKSFDWCDSRVCDCLHGVRSETLPSVTHLRCRPTSCL